MKKEKLIGYLGPEGTFTHEAVLKIIDNDSQIKAFENIINIFEALDNKDIDEAVVPIENSTEGSVLVTLDELTSFNIKIKAELILPIQQNLLVQKGKKIEDIKVICSHAQAIAQCKEYIHKLDKQVHAMSSTANAARYVKELSSAAVIGNKILSTIYDLEILEENIQDYDNNVTRFVLLSNSDQKEPTGHDKTSIVLSLTDDKPGSLYEILSEFSKEKINLTKIESRPSRMGIGKYLFFIDLEGHRKEPKIEKTLDIISDKVKLFKILGSYKTLNVGGK